MRVLVTGHRGYIGPIAVTVLRSRGHDVIGLDTGLFDRWSRGSRGDNVPSIRCDLRDVTPDKLEGIEAVVHLAALSNDPLGELDPELTYEINWRGTVRLAEAAKKAGAERFVFASSCSMYGKAGDDLVDETAPLMPLTHYATSKVRAEEALVRLGDDTFCPVLLRNATAYGVSPSPRVDLVLNNLVAWALSRGSVLIKSDGTPWRPVVHIEDISRACAEALTADRDAIHCEAFNVGANSENYQVKDLARIVAEEVEGCSVVYEAGGGPDPRSYRVDFSKLSRALPGATPQWTARAGARELARAMSDLDDGSIEDTEQMYSRVKQLQHLMSDGRLTAELRWREE